MSERIVAVVPARGGSKGIPGKNLKSFCGRPLIYWSLKAANDCPFVNEVYLGTDSESIFESVGQFDLPKVKAYYRDPSNCTDTSSTEDVLTEFVQKYKSDWVVLLQATSPLTTASDITSAIDTLKTTKANSLLSVCRQHRFIWRPAGSGLVEPLNYDPAARPRRQDWAGELIENGAFYIFKTSEYMKSHCRLNVPVTSHIMPDWTYTEIDSPEDWILAEQIFLNKFGSK